MQLLLSAAGLADAIPSGVALVTPAAVPAVLSSCEPGVNPCLDTGGGADWTLWWWAAGLVVALAVLVAVGAVAWRRARKPPSDANGTPRSTG